MHIQTKKIIFSIVIVSVSFSLSAQQVKVLVNHIGYEFNKQKHAIIEAENKIEISNFQIVDVASDKVVHSSAPVY